MDDLASEGLLLIRILPSDQGKYGFIVKVTPGLALSLLLLLMLMLLFVLLLLSCITKLLFVYYCCCYFCRVTVVVVVDVGWS